jgi:hypothetical protein
MTLDIVIPILMCAALLWWIGRGLSAQSMLIVTAVTLAIIVGIIFFENAAWR